MINNLAVKNFKSIKELNIDLKRINIFIGKPNSGKSNILECFGMFSFNYLYRVNELIRYSSVPDLFFERNIKNKIRIVIDNIELLIDDLQMVKIKFQNKYLYDVNLEEYYKYLQSELDKNLDDKLSSIKFYKFEDIREFRNKNEGFLFPPKGINLPEVFLSSKELRSIVSDLLNEFKLKLVIKVAENQLEVQSESEGIGIAYPFSTISETLKRTIFYLAAIKSNENSTIILEEPEAHAFPYYSKYLSEIISADENNQYIITTHNPYFLLTMIEKTSSQNLSIFTVSMQDSQTVVRNLTSEELSEILDLGVDIFFNVERFSA